MTEQTPQQATETGPAQARIRRIQLGVLALLVLSVVWYLAADRYTPHTDQARVQAFVVGVAPRVSGTLTRVLVHNNQQVEAGQVLFEIDDTSYRLAVEMAEADLQAARSRLMAANSSVKVARAQLEAAEAALERARKDAERQTRLYKKDPGAISVRRVERATATFQEAQANVDAARGNLAKAEEAVREAHKAVLAARSRLDQARYDLKSCRVVARKPGVITDLRAEVGDYVSQGQAIMTLITRNRLWVEAHFTENNLGHLKPGTPAEVVLDVLPGRVFKARVGSIGPGVSAWPQAQPGTLPQVDNSREWLRSAQRFPVEILLEPGQEGLNPESLRIGGQADVLVYTDKAWLLKPLGKLYIRLLALLSYAY